MMRLDFPWVTVPRQRRQLFPRRMTEEQLQRPSPGLRQLPNLEHANLGQPCLGDRAHSPHQLDRQVVKEVELGLGIDDHQPVGFGDLRGDLARCLVRATPTEIGRPSSARTRRRIVVAISAGGPKRWVQPATSAKASSMEIRSTRGVKSPNTLMAASPNRWYSLKWPLTKVSCGQSSRARRPDIPPRTP